MKNGDVFIGHDSGPMHLAAAVGVPCVALFGPVNRPKWWHPMGPRHRVLHNMDDVRKIPPVDVWRRSERCSPRFSSGRSPPWALWPDSSIAMRVLHVIPSIAPTSGGPSRAMVEIERALAGCGVEVTTVTTDDDGRAPCPCYAEPICDGIRHANVFPKDA